MRFVFLETPLFTRLLPGYLDDESYMALQQVLLRQPERGPVMAGTGGFRKLRWKDIRRGKGSRGGLRVIYYVLEPEQQIWLFTVYDKDEADDLTLEQCQLLKNAIREELRARKASP
jgi:mRNA-degrading endonuclease RelE of RelBE toxin-antitoxin system